MQELSIKQMRKLVELLEVGTWIFEMISGVEPAVTLRDAPTNPAVTCMGFLLPALDPMRALASGMQVVHDTPASGKHL